MNFPVTFEIPYPPGKGKREWNQRFGLNAYYSGKHYARRKKDAEELHWLAVACMKRAGIRKELTHEPVEVRFFWDDGLDIDNHAVIGKAVVDAMKSCILPEDNRRWVKKVSHEFWEGQKIRVEIHPWKERKHEKASKN